MAFSASRKPQNVVVPPRGLLTMKTWVISETTSHASLSGACLDFSFSAFQASETRELVRQALALELSQKSKKNAGF